MIFTVDIIIIVYRRRPFRFHFFYIFQTNILCTVHCQFQVIEFKIEWELWLTINQLNRIIITLIAP